MGTEAPQWDGRRSSLGATDSQRYIARRSRGPHRRIRCQLEHDDSLRRHGLYGNYYSDLWILSNADGTTGTPTWTLAAPLGGGPSARSQASAIYDSTNNVMTIFAGGTISTTAFNDVWTLSNANGLTGTPTWTQQLPSGTAPTARSGQSAVYDSANNRMIVHGGINTRGSVQNDTWILTGANGSGSTPA